MMDSHCRVRPAGPAVPADCDPPRTTHAALAARLGDARLLTLYDQATWSEGPAWWEAQRTLVWSDLVGRRVLGWREDGTVDVLLDATAFTNGNAVDAQQRWCTANTAGAPSPAAMPMARPTCWWAATPASGSTRPMT